ncbi:uncharacterized protein LOC135081783 [Ostrinia nubilalis]|uniref:uncharacterized protein LOC135081783 n=1 Tax=Ostrinia nubilalis TaxID=29057 RepID=UPI00308222CB
MSAVRKKDPIWDRYLEISNALGDKTGCRTQCKKCGKEMKGLVQRMKEHQKNCLYEQDLTKKIYRRPQAKVKAPIEAEVLRIRKHFLRSEPPDKFRKDILRTCRRPTKRSCSGCSFPTRLRASDVLFKNASPERELPEVVDPLQPSTSWQPTPPLQVPADVEFVNEEIGDSSRDPTPPLQVPADVVFVNNEEIGDRSRDPTPPLQVPADVEFVNNEEIGDSDASVGTAEADTVPNSLSSLDSLVFRRSTTENWANVCRTPRKREYFNKEITDSDASSSSKKFNLSYLRINSAKYTFMFIILNTCYALTGCM